MTQQENHNKKIYARTLYTHHLKFQQKSPSHHYRRLNLCIVCHLKYLQTQTIKFMHCLSFEVFLDYIESFFWPQLNSDFSAYFTIQFHIVRPYFLQLRLPYCPKEIVSFEIEITLLFRADHDISTPVWSFSARPKKIRSRSQIDSSLAVMNIFLST